MQLMTVRKVTRTTILIRGVLVAVVIGCVAGVWLGYKPAMARYQHWKQQRALDQARGFMTDNDFASAKLALDVALTAVPGDTHALEVAADLLEQVGSPEVMFLRRRMLLLRPDSLEDRVALVNAALRFGDLNAARDAIREIPEAQLAEPSALKAMLAYALAADNRPMADALYDRLRQIEPDNERLSIMHALLKLKSPRPDTVNEAQSVLNRHIGDPAYALLIQREMLASAMQRNARDEARAMAARIATNPRATLTDRLHDANFALNVDRLDFNAVLAGLVQHVGPDPMEVAELIRWTIMVGHHAEGEAWLQTLPADLQADPLLLPVHAELAAARADWDQMAALLEKGAWGSVDRDAIRLAFSAKLAADRNNPALQLQIWNEALAAAGRSTAGLTMLYRLAGIWGWPESTESALWAIVRNFPLQAWAHQSLFSLFRQRGETDKMLTLIGTLRERDGSMVRYRHDWSVLSMLLNRTLAWNPAKQTMSDLYRSDPENPHYITGYAFALAQSNRTDEALAIAATLPAEELELPARAPYLAYIHGMARNRAEFERYAAIERNLTVMLPEERTLFVLGREALTRPVSDRIESALEKNAASQAAAPQGE